MAVVGGIVVGDGWLKLVDVAGEWSVKVDWVIEDIVGGDVLSVVVGTVDWLEWGSCVIRVAVRRCRM